MNDFERVKASVDFIRYAERHMTLKRTGALHKAVCLWHDDHDPSLTLYADGYKCFVCGAAGDVFDLAMKLHNWTRQEALMELAREANVTLTPILPHNRIAHEKRERLYACLETWATAYQDALYAPFGCFALKYLRETRGLSDATIKAARVGYAPPSAWAKGFTDQENVDAGMLKRGEGDNIPYEVFRDRVMFPLFDRKGRIVGFSGRDMGQRGPKYINSRETDIFHKSQNIYGISSDKGGTRDFTGDKVKVIVEGYIDVISAYNRGFKNVYAQMGTSLSDDQLSLLAKGTSRLVFCFDNDAAGQMATRRLIETHLPAAQHLGIDLCVMSAPHGKDPDDTFRERPELWQGAVDAARPAVDVLIDMALKDLPSPPSALQKTSLIRGLRKTLTSDNPLVTRENMNKLASALNAPVEDIEALSRMEVSPKQTPASIPHESYPPMELTVLHGILVHDDQCWYERANSVLMLSGACPNALKGLNASDFSAKACHDLMLLIVEEIKQQRRPVNLQPIVGNGPLHEIYERAELDPETRGVLALERHPHAYTLPYDDFLKAVCHLRWLRLKRDMVEKRVVGLDTVEWMQAIRILERKKN